MRVFIVLSLLLQLDTYWQQLYGAQQGQCGASIVSLAKQLDDAKKEIENLQKQLKEKK